MCSLIRTCRHVARGAGRQSKRKTPIHGDPSRQTCQCMVPDFESGIGDRGSEDRGSGIEDRGSGIGDRPGPPAARLPGPHDEWWASVGRATRKSRVRGSVLLVEQRTTSTYYISTPGTSPRGCQGAAACGRGPAAGHICIVQTCTWLTIALRLQARPGDSPLISLVNYKLSGARSLACPKPLSLARLPASGLESLGSHWVYPQSCRVSRCIIHTHATWHVAFPLASIDSARGQSTAARRLDGDPRRFPGMGVDPHGSLFVEDLVLSWARQPERRCVRACLRACARGNVRECA
jgi:hypothetical protein